MVFCCFQSASLPYLHSRHISFSSSKVSSGISLARMLMMAPGLPRSSREICPFQEPWLYHISKFPLQDQEIYSQLLGIWTRTSLGGCYSAHHTWWRKGTMMGLRAFKRLCAHMRAFIKVHGRWEEMIRLFWWKNAIHAVFSIRHFSQFFGSTLLCVQMHTQFLASKYHSPVRE